MAKMIADRPWLWATHVWNMFDFAADGRDEGGKNGENQKGTTDNKSLTIATRVSSQMLSIWAALGFKDQAVKAKAAAGGEDDEL